MNQKEKMNNEIIKKYNIFAKKSLGQNFLVDTEKLSEIGNVLNVSKRNIVEVGPGYGALTEILLEGNPKSLHLVELDSDMVDILQDREQSGDFAVNEVDFQIFHQDILEYKPSFQEYSVIANIPYYITSPILRHFIYELQDVPESMLILMQKDVGDKILGKGKNKSSVLSLMVQKKCNVQEKIFVPKECFSPKPKVESTVLLFEKHNLYENIDDTLFLEFIKKGFLAPRKKLVKNLVSGGFKKEKIEKILCLQGCDLNFRGEDGNIDFWVELFDFLK